MAACPPLQGAAWLRGISTQAGAGTHPPAAMQGSHQQRTSGDPRLGLLAGKGLGEGRAATVSL